MDLFFLSIAYSPKQFMKLFNRHQKTFGTIGIILLLGPALFFIHPQKAEAVVPVNDLQANMTLASIAATEKAGWGSYVKKEFSLDLILWALAKALIHQLSQSIVQWIKTGFQGNPLFITDMERFLKDTANEATGIFLDNYVSPEVYDLLCAPWRNPIFFGILSLHGESDKYKPKCTLDVVVNNIEGMANFMDNFMNGGWDAFSSLTARPENNAYGAYLAAADKMEENKAKAKARSNTEAQMNKGFLGMKLCLNRTSSGLCEDWYTDSPGSWIADQLGWNTTSELRTLEIADEIDEILGALAGQMIKWAYQGITEQTRGSPGPSTVPPAPIPPTARQTLINAINETISSETAYRNTRQDTISPYSQAIGPLNTALACYTTYVNAWTTCAGIRSSVNIGEINNYINRLFGELSYINSMIPSLNNEVATANNLIISLQNLRARVVNATTAQELGNLSTEYGTLSQSAHNFSDQMNADREYTRAQNTLTDARWHINYCPSLATACVIVTPPER